jgi:hypothetical protein
VVIVGEGDNPKAEVVWNKRHKKRPSEIKVKLPLPVKMIKDLLSVPSRSHKIQR